MNLAFGEHGWWRGPFGKERGVRMFLLGNE